MKRLFIFLTFAFFLSGSILAQRGKNFDVEKFKKDRIEYLIKEAGITNEESRKFVPLCEEVLSKKFELNRELRRKNRELREKGSSATNADYEQLNSLQTETEIKEIELDKEYDQKFKTFLSAEKIHKYKIAEKKFMQITVKNKYKK